MVQEGLSRSQPRLLHRQALMCVRAAQRNTLYLSSRRLTYVETISHQLLPSQHHEISRDSPS